MTASLDASLCVHQVFERQAAASRDRTALVYEDSSLSYAELARRSNRLAHYLQRLGVGPEILVGIYVDRSLELVVALLAILKAGGAYLPIDPQYPRDRVSFMLDDSKTPLLLTQRALSGDLQSSGTRVICLDEVWGAVLREADTPPESAATPDNLAYVIYTSGSTGHPKGTLITHRNVVRLFQSTQHWFKFDSNDVWTLFHSCAFDFSVWEMWGALFFGGVLVVVPFDVSRTPERFHDLLGKSGVTVLNQTPSAFRQLMRVDASAPSGAAPALRLVIFGGEALEFRTLEDWFARHGDQHPRLVNMYGITETTVHVTYRPIRLADLDGPSLIGEPIPDLDIRLLDDDLQPVPAGMAGEIFVGGAGVARGYLNRPELTRQRFISNAPAVGSHDRGCLYRTGDSARRLPNGDLEYLGRLDQQVKIRGFRIELGEIVAAIKSAATLEDAIVVVRNDAGGEKVLVAYLVLRPGSEVGVVQLRQNLRERLPEYMVPAAFAVIPGIPLTVHGKLDHRALPDPTSDPFPHPYPDPDVQTSAAPSLTPPSTASTAATVLEHEIAAIWSDVLNIPTPGIDQNFFDVGGNSLNLAEVHARIQSLLARQFSITELFAHTTISSLAAHFAAVGGGEPGPGPAPRARVAAQRAQRQRAALAAQRSQRRPA